MNKTVNEKLIKEMCGTVSFKRGDYFYRAKKVNFEQYGPDCCQATVTGEDNFHVTIETDILGDIQTTCSCPKLASFAKDCQHIAAVLLAIHDHQQKATIPNITNSPKQELTEGLLTLFTDQPNRKSGHQLHFENRKMLDIEFTCKPVEGNQGQYLVGVEITLGLTSVQNIRDFLEHVRDGKSYLLSPAFTYDQRLHCFQKESDAVLQQLIQVLRDEKVYVDAVQDMVRPQLLLIPSSSWERLLPLLLKAPRVMLAYDGQTFSGLHITEESLPLQFDFTEVEGKGYQLKVKGFHRMLVFDSYRSVLYEGKIKQLEAHDCQRLSDLKQMLAVSGTNQIPIPQEQIQFFLEKVAPGLKKLGKVTISGVITKQLMNTPLVAPRPARAPTNPCTSGRPTGFVHRFAWT